MRDLGYIVAVIAAALAIVAVSVFAGHDTSVLVPPPDAVTETFVRDLGMERYELAHRYLARDVKAHTSADDLRTTFEPLRQAAGKPDQIVTTTSSTSGDRARVLATYDGRHAIASMYVDLSRERGVWKVAAWPVDVVQRP
jgi:hypothetical protein